MIPQKEPKVFDKETEEQANESEKPLILTDEMKEDKNFRY